MHLQGMELVGAAAGCDMMLGVLQCGRGRRRACIMFTPGVKILKRSVEADEDEDGNRRAGVGAGAGAGGGSSLVEAGRWRGYGYIRATRDS